MPGDAATTPDFGALLDQLVEAAREQYLTVLTDTRAAVESALREALAERDEARGAIDYAMSERAAMEAERDREWQTAQDLSERCVRLAAALRDLLVFHAADDETLLSRAAPDYRAAVLKARALASSPETTAALPGPDNDAATKEK